jgi:transcriptional regulator with XRE-family HTH domain
MGNDIDVYLGKRLRRRRRLLGLTQQQLAGTVGVRFQQIQKYECGANRISAARLWQLSEALEVPVGYFYDGLSDRARRKPTSRPRAARCSPARRRWTWSAPITCWASVRVVACWTWPSR